MDTNTSDLPAGFKWQYGSAIKEKADGTLWDFSIHTDHAEALSAVKEWYEEDEETDVRGCVIIKRVVLEHDWNEGWIEE